MMRRGIAGEMSDVSVWKQEKISELMRFYDELPNHHTKTKYGVLQCVRLLEGVEDNSVAIEALSLKIDELLRK